MKRLVEQCTLAAREGAEFPAIWDSILKSHMLVVGRIKPFDDEKSHIDIRLRICFWLRGARSKDFSLRRAPLHRSF